jgi:NitT/TauT family transport system ATP-binding protein
MAIELKSISKSFGPLEVLKDISLGFDEGAITVILGPSGCGKTTLLNIVAGLCPFDSGERRGTEGLRFSYAFQESRLLPWLTAEENAAFALSGLVKSGEMGRAEAEARVGELLAAAGLAEAAKRRPDQLSGGMRQRLSLVRAFAYPADFLLLDEAFTAVDLRTKMELMDAFLALWREEKPTVLCVTHDVEEAVYLADRAIVLAGKPGRIADDFPIAAPRGERKLGSASTLDAEARLYELILSPN